MISKLPTRIENAIKTNNRDEFFNGLYREYVPVALRSLQSFDLSPLQPMDVVQDVLKAWANKPLSDFRAETLGGLLHKSCYNKALELYRRRKDWMSTGQTADDILMAKPDYSFTSDLFEDARLYCLQVLNPKYRDIYIDYLDGYKLREIAERRGMTLSTVKKYKIAARKFLRDVLIKRE